MFIGVFFHINPVRLNYLNYKWEKSYQFKSSIVLDLSIHIEKAPWISRKTVPLTDGWVFTADIRAAQSIKYGGSRQPAPAKLAAA